jgi:hypothetical protein
VPDDRDAVALARKLIDAGTYGGYGAWHLAVDPKAAEETKGRYKFPYGEWPAASLRVVGGRGSFHTTSRAGGRQPAAPARREEGPVGPPRAQRFTCT